MEYINNNLIISLNSDINNYKNNIDNLKRESEMHKDDYEKIFNKLTDKIEGLGTTILNVIITFSLVTSMIAICLKIKVALFPILIIGITWILLTCLLFIGTMFKKYDKQFYKDLSFVLSLIIYLIVTILLIIISYFTYKYLDTSKEDKKIINKCIAQNNVVTEEDN